MLRRQEKSPYQPLDPPAPYDARHDPAANANECKRFDAIRITSRKRGYGTAFPELGETAPRGYFTCTLRVPLAHDRADFQVIARPTASHSVKAQPVSESCISVGR